ncbi:molecular chaperone [Novosphingobium resinovorum]|uniref:fimbrial biogenesis chaperone n=1 Tax=Novosphingobium resinovorum TaxID=158500 RepID=UPI002ED647B2|nr:molecular chaperone [Novosphingobium resinovorum]
MRTASFAVLAAAAAALCICPACLGPAIAQSPAAGGASGASGPGSLLIWPINPVIEGDAQAAALWLENPGRAPITLQVRVYAWAQQDGRNVYAAQNDILGTPPILSVEPGQRQLVRLTRLVPPPGVPEKPYRIVVDQIPTAPDVAAGAPQQASGAAIAFRMRYSLPLFSYAADTGHAAKGRDKAATPPPPSHLGWRTGSDDKGRFLEIRNDGPGHARLTDVAFSGKPGSRAGGKGSAKVADGLFGYVLPGATMRWPLPAGTEPTGDLVASLNGDPGARIERLPE